MLNNLLSQKQQEGLDVSRIDLKIANRLCENRLLTAEKFSTIASLLGYPYPAIQIYADDPLNDHILYSRFRVSIGNNIYTRKITLPWAPNIGEKRVDDYGVALINNGTIATSIENDGTICLALMHTAEWAFSHNPWAFQGQKLEKEFIPEHKTHAFFYSLYPHKGNWVDACAYKVGYKFNNKLIAKISDPTMGGLEEISDHNIEVNIANDYIYKEISGKFKFYTAPGCKVTPKEKEVVIKKNSFFSIPVKLNKKQGFLRADFISDDFHLTAYKKDFWAILKLAYNGYVEYIPIKTP